MECMDRHPDLQPGTEKFYQEVGKRFSEIIDKTQVVDSVLHRTQIMRSENGLTKMATSFMGEPLKTNGHPVQGHPGSSGECAWGKEKSWEGRGGCGVLGSFDCAGCFTSGYTSG